MQTGVPGISGITMRVYCIPVAPSWARNGIRFSRHDEYADKENHINPAKYMKKHVTKQGTRYGQYTPITGIPDGETHNVRSVERSDREGCDGTRNAERSLP
jgi:hypothetical protein